MELLSDEILERKLKYYLDRRRLPDAFLYVGDSGTRNWLALESSTRFPVAATLTTLMREHAGAFARQAVHCRTVVSIGAGDAQKELLLLRELTQYSHPVCHIVDVSRPLVEAALRTLGGLGIETRGVTAFCEDLDRLAPHWSRPVLLCLLGNNFSNYDPALLLSLIGSHLESTDALLLDASLLPEDRQDVDAWVREVETIYNSPENVRFNIAPLVARGMDPQGCRFELKLIRVAHPWGEVWRTQKRIHVLRPAVVRCGSPSRSGAASREIAFAAGEVIEMGFTYKYRFPQLRDCLEQHGFNIADRRLDATGHNVILLAPKKTKETAR